MAVLSLFIFCLGLMAFDQDPGKGKKKAKPAQAGSSIEQKMDSLIKLMTLEEKVAMLHGNSLFSSAGVPRLGIPELKSTDGPLGIREELGRDSWGGLGLTTDSATFFPAGGALAATWNPALVMKIGVGMGEEARARGKDVLLAPAVNIMRTPLCGRNFEYYTEDPFLNARLAVAVIKGIQSQDVAACVKHYAANNQETNRGSVNDIIDERTLREIYLPAFKAAVQEAQVSTVMSAYNKVRGDYCSENDYLLNKILRTEWGFKGAVISDWGGTHSSVKAAKNGLDIEMGSDGKYDTWFFAKALLDSVKAGKVSEKVIDAKVRNILWVMNQSKMMDASRKKGALNTAEHSKTVYQVAAEAVVLLKNTKGLLPLKANGIKNLAVIGDNAIHKQAIGGFGAGVKARYEITPLEGLKKKLGNQVNIQFAQGYKEKYLPKTANQTGKEADNRPDASLIEEAVKAAKAAEVAIVVVGTNREYETEASDRKDMHLPFGQEELIQAVTQANPNTVVVVIAGAALDLTKAQEGTSALLWSWFSGSEAGNSLADVLFGAVNPSGKLPFTIPKALGDSPAHALNTFPGENLTANYKEGILVGYRWFDTKKIEPLYCFGHGLSYSAFTYSAVNVNKKVYLPNDLVEVSLKVKNEGMYAGQETVQLYIQDTQSSVLRADKELKAFQKISLQPGQESTVQFKISVKDLAFFNEKTMKWVVEPGEFLLHIGSSSRDIRGKATITVK